jgi:hypothetical protein
MKTKFTEFIKENSSSIKEVIVITKQETDERSNKKENKKYDVNYQITVDGTLFEIEGELVPYNSGRAEEYKFEPSQFDDKETEEYYDEHWEEIEEQILKKFKK